MTVVAASPPVERDVVARANASPFAWLLMGVSVAAYLAYGWAAIVRFEAQYSTVAAAMGALVLIALWLLGLARPFLLTLVVLAAIPLFGNHPGGRLMELVNLPLAASTAGLLRLAQRERNQPPRGWIWVAADAYVLSAWLAIIPTVPGLMTRAAQVNDWPLLLFVTLTAAEDNALYSVASLVLLTLAAAWARALAWASPPDQFVVTAYRVFAIGLCAVMVFGILDFHGVISIESAYRARIDLRRQDVLGLQSIFWNPGWFAWYFVLTFSIALGLSVMERRPIRLALAVALAICYAYAFANPQRGGLIIIHVVLAAFALYYAIRVAQLPRPTLIRGLATGAIAVAISLTAVMSVEPTRLPRPVQRLRSTLGALVHPGDALLSSAVRPKLWRAATMMWGDSPVFGLGEGSFAWRFRDYAPEDSTLFTPNHGDAHSTWLQLLATRGLLGLAAYLVLLFVVGKAVVAQLREQRSTMVLPPALALVAFVTYSFVQSMFYLQAIQVLFWFLVFAIARSADASGVPSRATRMALSVAGAVLASVQLIATRPLVAEAAGQVASDSLGFYGVEAAGPQGAPLRWTSRVGVLSLDPRAPRVRVRFQQVDPRVEAVPRQVTLRIGDAVVEQLVVSDRRVITIFLDIPQARAIATPPRFGACTPESVRLTIENSRTWSPADAWYAPDPRPLGIAVFEPVYLNRAK